MGRRGGRASRGCGARLRPEPADPGAALESAGRCELVRGLSSVRGACALPCLLLSCASDADVPETRKYTHAIRGESSPGRPWRRGRRRCPLAPWPSPAFSPAPGSVVLMKAFDVGNCEVHICKQTAVAVCGARLRRRAGPGVRLQKSQRCRPARSASSRFLVTPEWDELLLL